MKGVARQRLDGVVPQPQLPQLAEVLEGVRGHQREAVVEELQGVEVGEAGERSNFNLTDLVFGELEDLEVPQVLESV